MKYHIDIYDGKVPTEESYLNLEELSKHYVYLQNDKITSTEVADISINSRIYNKDSSKRFKVEDIRIQQTGVDELRIDISLKEISDFFVV